MISGWRMAVNSLFPWMTGDNTVTNSRDDQTNFGRSNNLYENKTVD